MPTPSSAERHAAERSKIARAIEREKHRPVGDPMPVDEAHKLTDAIRRTTGTLEELIQRAYLGRAWSALGYASWNAYCDTEFASVRLRLPREEREKKVCRLVELGLSVRAIEAATGISHTTVQKDIAKAKVCQTGTPGGDGVIDAEVVPKPKPIIGADGKTYPPRKPTPTAMPDVPDAPAPTPRRAPIADLFQTAAWRMCQAALRVEQLSNDDRFAATVGELADQKRDLIEARDALQRVIDKMSPPPFGRKQARSLSAPGKRHLRAT